MTSAYPAGSTQQPADPHEHPVVIHPSPGPHEPHQATDTTPKVGQKGVAFWNLDHRPGTTMVLFLASLVLLIQTCMDCTPVANCTKYFAWGLSVAVVSTTLSMLLFFLLTLRGDYQEDAQYGPVEGTAPIRKTRPEHIFLVVLLWCIWLPGTGLLTFISPYTLLGNAYIACWLGFITSSYLLLQTVHHNFAWAHSLGHDVARVALFLIMLASVIELVQASLSCPPLKPNSGGGGCDTRLQRWALATGIASSVFAFCTLLIAFFRKSIPPFVLKIVAILLFAWWIPAAGTLTWMDPFTLPGNAYFACWAAYLASGYLFYAALFTRTEEAHVKPVA